MGGAIYNDGSATVNFNRIINNNAVTGTQIYNDIDGTIDATLNWWGTNTSQHQPKRYNRSKLQSLDNTNHHRQPHNHTNRRHLNHNRRPTHDNNNGLIITPLNGVIPYTGISQLHHHTRNHKQQLI